MDRLATLTRAICYLATRTGEKVMRFYEGGAEIKWKKDASPLTSADGASHDFLIESLRSLTPGVLVISEESEEAANRFAASGGFFWLVDTLDGTKEFLKRINEFTVNIALMSNDDQCWALSMRYQV